MAVLLRFDNGEETTIADNEFRRLLSLSASGITRMKLTKIPMNKLEVHLEELVIPHLTKKVNGYG